MTKATTKDTAESAEKAAQASVTAAKKAATASKKAATKEAPAKAATTKKAPAKSAAAKEADAKIAAAKEAEKAAQEAMKAAAKEAEKAKEEAEKAAKKAKTEQKLERSASEINARLAKAMTYTEKADDFRLSAAQIIATAKEECREAGIPFKEWCETHLDKSYEEARKLVPIGAAENEKEGEGAKMLADLRAGAAARNKKLREKKAAATQTETKKAASKPDTQKAWEIVDGLKDEERKNLVKSVAESEGLMVITVDDAKKARAAVAALEAKDGEDAKVSPQDRAEAAFNRLPAKSKIAFAKWVAEQIGATLTMEEADEGDDEKLEMPASLKRNA